MVCEVLGRAAAPRPWRPHTQSSAEQPGGTTHRGETMDQGRHGPVWPFENPKGLGRVDFVSLRRASAHSQATKLKRAVGGANRHALRRGA
jgi:hypothetical protein